MYYNSNKHTYVYGYVLAFIEMMNSVQLELKQVLKYFIDINMFKNDENEK